ncbi:hypothetical protein [Agromyces sp. NPDC057865]|uniref:hypothetical protein n=1 Tax=Agromyces sp. NPDC057865 TaxID=3346267 RepID=UPI0036700D46
MNADALAATVAANYSCPECESKNQLVNVTGGAYLLNIQHKPGCPLMSALERDHDRRG